MHQKRFTGKAKEQLLTLFAPDQLALMAWQSRCIQRASTTFRKSFASVACYFRAWQGHEAPRQTGGVIAVRSTSSKRTRS